ncbi:MAG: leucyl aminopeptidase, partial [Rhodoblastus sp.]|nr:leucyl aminopeptidase [Rhodoblastus sp.]
LTRELVNRHPGEVYPESFADRAAQVASQYGLACDIFDEPRLRAERMNSLLGVAQGSVRPARMVVLEYQGAGPDRPWLALVGKGVTFDSGGLSLKPSDSMKTMKGDMAGAATVLGALAAIAQLKLPVNVLGLMGLVENMPSGSAYKLGEVLTARNGVTIEVMNTDAEGRLVLADVLWHVQTKYKPSFMVDLATLTGAIMVALGQEYAGLFSNNDELSERLRKSGEATGEKVWRMPLAPAYDKMIDSKFADMKNTGGRYGGSITAAQFLQRYVEKTPWAHLDIAGTGMGSPSSDINQSWGSGWGVRLLDRMVKDFYEG